MRALVIETEGRARLREVVLPAMGEGDVRVAVRHVGLCGSDLNTYKGRNPLAALPRIPGHEIGGVIVATGRGVASDYTPGRRVIVMPYTNCGTCSACRKGRTNACRNNRTLGVQQDGGLADEIVLPAEKLILNETLAPRSLSLVEPLSVGFHAVARGRIGAGDRVVVLGCGMIGLGAVIGAVTRGAEVIALDVSRAKTATATRLGAAHVVDASTEDAAARVAALTGGDGPDVVIEAVGLPETFVQAIDLASFAGRVVYVGYCKAPVTYQTAIFNLKELDITGSRNATLDDFHRVIAHLERMGETAADLISKTFSFDEAEAAFPYWDAHRDAIKVMIEW